MSKIISLQLAMGGDNSPSKTIEGIKFFLNKNKNKNDFILNLFGKESDLLKEIKKHNIQSDFIKIINADTIVSDNETPLTAVKNSKNSSMWKCINYQLEGNADISLSATIPGFCLYFKNDFKMMSIKSMAGSGQIKWNERSFRFRR